MRSSGLGGWFHRSAHTSSPIPSKWNINLSTLFFGLVVVPVEGVIGGCWYKLRHPRLTHTRWKFSRTSNINCSIISHFLMQCDMSSGFHDPNLVRWCTTPTTMAWAQPEKHFAHIWHDMTHAALKSATHFWVSSSSPVGIQGKSCTGDTIPSLNAASYQWTNEAYCKYFSFEDLFEIIWILFL